MSCPMCAPIWWELILFLIPRNVPIPKASNADCILSRRPLCSLSSKLMIYYLTRTLEDCERLNVFYAHCLPEKWNFRYDLSFSYWNTLPSEKF